MASKNRLAKQVQFIELNLQKVPPYFMTYRVKITDT